MHIKFKLAVITVAMAALAVFVVTTKLEITGLAQTETASEMPGVITLAPDAKLGAVRFDHVSHNSGKYSIAGGPIACIECHHVAQPAEEAAKHPPLKTAWPEDRTTTLTLELYKADALKAGVAACRSCQAQAGQTPKLMPEIPEIKHQSSTAMIKLNNQQAFHRNCAGCHAEANKENPDLKAPTATQCTVCHKR
jgi:hypothetical protein